MNNGKKYKFGNNVPDSENHKRAEEEREIAAKLISSNDPANHRKAFSHFLNSAELGNSVSQTQVGFMYMEGIGISKDTEKGIYWMKKAADNQSAMAECNLAEYYASGYGVPKDDNKAVEYLLRASKHGDDLAALLLAKRYEAGQGVPPNSAKAYDQYLLAIKRGNIDAFNELFTSGNNESLKGPSECRSIIKKEFDAYLAIIKKCIPVQDTNVPQKTFDAVMYDKHIGYYVKASRTYMFATLQLGCLSSNVAVAWMKVLASSGAVKEAIALGKYVLEQGEYIEHRINYSWFMLECITCDLDNSVSNKAWFILSSQVNKLAGKSIPIQEIDVYQEEMNR